MPVNKALLMATMKRVEKAAEEGLWDQGSYINSKYGCKTMYCFAGWACVLNGHTEEQLITIENKPDLGSGIHELAQKSLGLSDYQASYLFSPHNNLEKLRDLVCELVQEEEKEETHGD